MTKVSFALAIADITKSENYIQILTSQILKKNS